MGRIVREDGEEMTARGGWREGSGGRGEGQRRRIGEGEERELE